MYNLGDRIIVTKRFSVDNMYFNPGDAGKIIDFLSGVWMTIEWDFEHPRLHSHDLKGAEHQCWTIRIDEEGISLEEVHSGNPLPEDPRLRGIAHKIVQLETAFKQRQELKKKGVTIKVPETLRTSSATIGATTPGTFAVSRRIV